MADLNALIAQGAQFQAPVDPFTQYGKMQQLQQGQQANALNQMKMEEYQRGLQEQNALRSSVSSDFDINNPAHVNAVLRASPTAGAAFLEKFSQGAKERGLAEKAKNEAIKFNLDNSRSLLVGINDQPSYDAWRAYSVKTLPQLADMLPTAFSQDAKDRLMQAADDVSKKLTAAPVYENAAPGATVLRNGVPIYTAPAAVEKPKVTDLMANYQAAVGQGFTGSIFDYERKLKEAGRAPVAAKDDPNTTAAFREVDNAGNVTFYNKFGLPISTQKGAGKPSATFEKTKQGKAQLVKDLDQAIVELTDVTKDGGLIDQSTGSGVGRAVDIGARFIGKATPGDIAIGKLQPIADLSLKMIPRFEGPQSNADTTSYKQAAGQLADPTLPPEIRKAAGKTVLRLMKSRKDQFTTVDMATNAAPDATGESAINAADAILNKTRK